ncbi:membrane protein yajC [Candidatus Photodesmus katoptron]|uniref:Sec translocon accessory complex subunit YajC n=1 Tax=Candidatus Photodesmus katoptron Akat1 TaxID=1236703 RepID=S3DLB4_9GAMM|nr:preprotein translocase subunit YajC [Candidatus Photodesmus katoptron]EPE37944.1 preprotein translocase, YajC subunit [Candidatus Photodesmus katoptron Akat1]KEY90269.1 membrane protein yajC [Candidatus Photodesmus katoptron]
MFIPQVHAEAKGYTSGSGYEMLIMLGVFALVFYFLIYRPQSKRIKEHKKLISSITKGDEVLTSGGLVGKIIKISENSDCVSIKLNENNEVLIQKSFITTLLPKGTLKSL